MVCRTSLSVGNTVVMYEAHIQTKRHGVRKQKVFNSQFWLYYSQLLAWLRHTQSDTALWGVS